MLGVPLALNDAIKWRIAIVGKKGQKKPEFTEPLDVSRGGEQFMAFFQGNSILGAIDLADFSTGRMFFCTGACYRGDYAYLYPSGGLLMDTMIDPLGRAVKKLGCDIVIATLWKRINGEVN